VAEKTFCDFCGREADKRFSISVFDVAGEKEVGPERDACTRCAHLVQVALRNVVKSQHASPRK
jgi:hypothetical protein